MAVPPAAPQPLQTQRTQLTVTDMQQPGLPLFNALLQAMQNQIDSLLGANGKTPLPSGVDMAGSTITGLGLPQTMTDAVSVAHAEAKYSAAAIAPKLEAGGTSTLKTFRAVNSKQQIEKYSTFLNGMMNSAPTTNNSIITAGAPGGGSIAVTTTAGYHYYVDGEKITPYAQRTDTLTLPTSVNISSIARSGNVVTLVTASPAGYTVGEGFAVQGVADGSFNGGFIVLTIVGTTITYVQNGPNATSSGGTVSTNSVYYHYIQGNSRTLALAGPFATDSQVNRLGINIDQSVLISTIVLNGSGLDSTNSAGGATPPTSGARARVLVRL